MTFPTESERLAPLYGAKAEARAEFPDIPKNRTATVRMKDGGSYSYKYADLADVFSAVNPILAANGLDVSQWPDGNTLMTRIAHSSGASEVTPWPIKAMPKRGLDDCQAFQSAVQVAKRYALTAILGIATEETVEGDMRSRSPNDGINDKFETQDGLSMPRGAKITKDMSPREKAEEAARAIEAQFQDPKIKTQVGINGVWNRNERFINVLHDRHTDLFDNVLDIFRAEMGAREDDAAAKGAADLSVVGTGG